MTVQRGQDGITRIIPDLEREVHVGEVRTSERGSVAVTIGWAGEQRCIRLQAYRLLDEPKGWAYQGRGVVIPLEQVGELRALLERLERES